MFYVGFATGFVVMFVLAIFALRFLCREQIDEVNSILRGGDDEH